MVVEVLHFKCMIINQQNLFKTKLFYHDTISIIKAVFDFAIIPMYIGFLLSTDFWIYTSNISFWYKKIIIPWKTLECWQHYVAYELEHMA